MRCQVAADCFEAFNVMCLHRCYLVPQERGGVGGWLPRTEDGFSFPLGWQGADKGDDWFADPVVALLAMGQYLDQAGG